MGIRCTECKKEIIPLTKDSDWMGLWFFLEFLLEEGYIEKATYETQIDRLMTFKAWASTMYRKTAITIQKNARRWRPIFAHRKSSYTLRS